MIGDRGTQLFCAWWAWFRFPVILPMWDKTLPSVVACIDGTLRRFCGAPTCRLANNEKVNIDTSPGSSSATPEMVAAAHHHGLTVATCVVADPEAKGGSESTVRIAKADLVPADANLLERRSSFEELEAAAGLA